MKESELNDIVFETLNEFESMENIQPSAGWNQSLMNRLDNVRPHSRKFCSSNKICLLVLLVVMINLGFILNTVMNDSHKKICRNKDLQIISREFFINPIR